MRSMLHAGKVVVLRSAGSACLFGDRDGHGGSGGVAREINRRKPLARLQRRSGALWWSARPRTWLCSPKVKVERCRVVGGVCSGDWAWCRCAGYSESSRRHMEEDGTWMTRRAILTYSGCSDGPP
jgi:hypothetical protein